MAIPGTYVKTYSIEKIKEEIVKNNPLWNKYIRISGILKYKNLDPNSPYIVSEDDNTRIELDKNCIDKIIEEGISDGDSIQLEGYLNYGGLNQKSKENIYTKINGVNMSDSYLHFYFTPKTISFNSFTVPVTSKIKPKQNDDEITDLEAAWGCIIIVAIIIIFIILYFIFIK